VGPVPFEASGVSVISKPMSLSFWLTSAWGILFVTASFSMASALLDSPATADIVNPTHTMRIRSTTPMPSPIPAFLLISKGILTESGSLGLVPQRAGLPVF